MESRFVSTGPPATSRLVGEVSARALDSVGGSDTHQAVGWTVTSQPRDSGRRVNPGRTAAPIDGLPPDVGEPRADGVTVPEGSRGVPARGSSGTAREAVISDVASSGAAGTAAGALGEAAVEIE